MAGCAARYGRMRGSLTVFGGSCHLAGNTRTDSDHRRGEANANRDLNHTPVRRGCMPPGTGSRCAL